MGKFIQIFRDDQQISQIRLNILSLNEEVRNIKLIFSKRHFVKPVMLFYERHKLKDEKSIIEYYANNKLESYSETETLGNKKITKCFSNEGVVFSREIVIFNENDKAILIKNKIKNADGTTTISKENLN